MQRIEQHLGGIDGRLSSLADAYEKVNSQAIQDHYQRRREEMRRQAEGDTDG
jgi:hypothetical protein